MQQYSSFKKEKFWSSLMGLILISCSFSSCGDKQMSLAHLRVEKNSAQKGSAGQTAGQEKFKYTFQDDIKPLFEAKCASCHGAGSPLGDWTNYEIVVSKKDRIVNRVFEKKDMPMGGTLTSEERAMVNEWVLLGAPEHQPLVQSKPEDESPSPTQPPAQSPQPTPPQQPQQPAQPPSSPTPSTPADPATEILNYSKIKENIFNKHCQICHNENTGSMMPNWSVYKNAFDKKEVIYQRVVVDKTMPPAGFVMPDEDRELVKKWIEEGAIE